MTTIKKSSKIQSLVQTLKDNESTRIDLVMPARSIKFSNNLIHLSNIHEFNTLFEVDNLQNLSLFPSTLCLEQIADRLEIGRTFQRKLMSENITLFEHIVNELLKVEPDKKFLFRIVTDGEESICRAILSDSFKIMDNVQTLEITLKAIEKVNKKPVLQSFQITNKKFIVKFLFDSPNNDYQCGCVLTNSEVGLGKFSIAPFVETQNVCFIDTLLFGKTHHGTKLSGGHQKNNLDKKETIFDNMVYWIEKMSDSSFYSGRIIDTENKSKKILIEDSYEIANAVLKKVIPSHKLNDDFKYVFDRLHYKEKPMDILLAVSKYIESRYPEELYNFESSSIELLDFINNY